MVYHLNNTLSFSTVYKKWTFEVRPSLSHTWGRFHEGHRNLQCITALWFLDAMDFVSYNGLSIISQDMINHSTS